MFFEIISIESVRDLRKLEVGERAILLQENQRVAGEISSGKDRHSLERYVKGVYVEPGQKTFVVPLPIRRYDINRK